MRDANWRLQQLQTQYDFLASKTSSQGTAFKDAEERLEVSISNPYNITISNNDVMLY